jgi:hypothetical protein
MLIILIPCLSLKYKHTYITTGLSRICKIKFSTQVLQTYLDCKPLPLNHCHVAVGFLSEMSGHPLLVEEGGGERERDENTTE